MVDQTELSQQLINRLDEMASPELLKAQIPTADWQNFPGGYALRVQNGSTQMQSTAGKIQATQDSVDALKAWAEKARAKAIRAEEEAERPSLLGECQRLRALLQDEHAERRILEKQLRIQKESRASLSNYIMALREVAICAMRYHKAQSSRFHKELGAAIDNLDRTNYLPDAGL